MMFYKGYIIGFLSAAVMVACFIGGWQSAQRLQPTIIQTGPGSNQVLPPEPIVLSDRGKFYGVQPGEYPLVLMPGIAPVQDEVTTKPSEKRKHK